MIYFDHVKKSYPNFQLDLSMDIPKDRITALIGRNGSGKTTAFSLLMGLIQPDSGTARIFDTNTWEIGPEIKQKIGVVFADSGFPDNFTMQDVGVMQASFYPSFDANLFQELCQRLELDMHSNISRFSTGMKAKAKMISALCHSPQLLILDEPTAGLDVIARKEVLDLIRTYMETPGRSVLISSHIASDLETLCDDFIFIDEGKQVLYETIDAIQDDYALIQMSRDEKESVDPAGILGCRKTLYGYECLCREKQFYQENYPQLRIAPAKIDDILMILSQKGEEE